MVYKQQATGGLVFGRHDMLCALFIIMFTIIIKADISADEKFSFWLKTIWFHIDYISDCEPRKKVYIQITKPFRMPTDFISLIYIGLVLQLLESMNEIGALNENCITVASKQLQLTSFQHFLVDTHPDKLIRMLNKLENHKLYILRKFFLKESTQFT